MRLLLSLIVILSIPYSTAMAQNSTGTNRLFIGKQGDSGCEGCKTKLYTGSKPGSTPKPFNIKQVLSNSGAQTGMRYQDVSSPFSMNRPSESATDSLQKLAMQNQQIEMDRAFKFGEERQRRVAANQAKLLEQQNYYEAQVRADLEKYKAEARQRREAAYSGSSAPPVDRKGYVYKGADKEETKSKRPGTRVFLSTK